MRPAVSRQPARAAMLCVTGALALALAGCQPTAPDPSAAQVTSDGEVYLGDVAFEPCSLSAPLGSSVEARCTSITVPENHQEPDGRSIELAVAWIEASGSPQPDPLVMIAGGPGQSALESYPQLHDAFNDIRRNRHVLLVDARGTGGSNLLTCRDEDGNNAFGDPDDYTVEAARSFAERCRDQLSTTADLRFYGTADHVRDLDRVRDLVGAPQLNLVGISYGTRVAQQYAAAYPTHTRTLLLDSVVPNDVPLGAEHARNLEDALNRLFERCRQETACVDNLGDPATNLAQVRERLEAGGLEPVDYRDPISGEWNREVPSYGHLASLLRMYAYQPAATATLPLLLHEASEGRYGSLLAQARMLMLDLGDAIAHGMQLSVMCTEEYPDLQSRPEDEGTVLGTDLLDFTMAQCEVWPRGERAADFRQPLATDVPVLAISGEFDPVTPSRYGDAVVKHLANGHHLVLPGQGHSVLQAGCMPALAAQFIESADASVLDATCLDRLQPVPPFAGTYGWEP